MMLLYTPTPTHVKVTIGHVFVDLLRIEFAVPVPLFLVFQQTINNTHLRVILGKRFQNNTVV